MPTQDTNQSQTPSPFEIVTPGKSKKSAKGIIIALVITLFLGLGIFAGVLLVRQNQNVAEKAAEDSCPEAQACPDQRETFMLRDCKKPDGDGTPRDLLCTKKGRIESCGGSQFCCPDTGQTWVKDMTACASPSATATATATGTATSTATSTSTASATATSTAKATTTAKATVAPTKPPIPETGTGWPTYVGAGVGVLVIIGSFLLAF